MKKLNFIASLLVPLLMLGIVPQAFANTIERLGIGYDGSETQGSGSTVMSNDGRYFLLGSYATNFVPTSTNGQFQLYVYDRITQATDLVSKNSNGIAANYHTTEGDMSDDGRYVAFVTSATNLIPNDTNGEQSDVFLHDRVTGITKIINIAADGTQANQNSSQVSISADGRYVIFSSYANNLVPDDHNGDVNIFAGTDLFLFDNQTNTLQRVNTSADGTEANDEPYEYTLSRDGKHVLFTSAATNLVPNDTNGRRDIFMKDIETGAIEIVNLLPNGEYPNQYVGPFSISDNAEIIAFASRATNLVPNDTNNARDIFVHNRITGETKLVSISSNGTQGNTDANDPDLSGNGQFVTFYSLSNTLTSGDTNNATDNFVHDIMTGKTELVSKAYDGSQSNTPFGTSGSSFISYDGTYVLLNSVATNLIPNDTNGQADPFLVTRIPNDDPLVGTISTSPNPVQINTAVSASATITDPDAGDTHTAVWDWGDGSTSVGSVNGLQVSGNHTYATAGVYTIGLTVTDSQGGTGSSTYQYLTAYTPVFGKVSGAKEFTSPAGAVVGNPSATGKANFGFQVDYQQGSNVPTGSDIELTFPAGNINFVSNAYEWVVINGTKATLKATGALNGTSGYTVLVSAIDSGNQGGLIRYQIKDASGNVVYDTQPGAADTADPVTSVSKGKIRVQ